MENTSFSFGQIFLILAYLANLSLLFLNLYGQTKSLRFKDFSSIAENYFRFNRKHPDEYSRSIRAIKDLKKAHSTNDYVQQATNLVNKSIVHLEWLKLDPITSYQLVPIWENPVLFALGKYSGLDQYKRYNFTNYKKSIERGFGVCGDASMILSQLLSKKRIPHKIVAFSEHVIIEAKVNNTKIVLDPDFNVIVNASISEVTQEPALIADNYTLKGYPYSDVELLSKIYSTKFWTYSSVYSFVPKRYLLERISYFLFWFAPPLSLGLLTVMLFR